MEKLEVEKALKLLIKHFGLSDETNESLEEKLSIVNQTSKRIEFYKNTEAYWNGFSQTLEESFHKLKVNVLKEYADEKALKSYMKKEGYKFVKKNTLNSVFANRFIIYFTENTDSLHNHIKNRFKKRYESWEFEKINQTFSIAYI